MFDKYAMSIGAVRVSAKDPNLVWVGTGESWARNSVGYGDGVYKTTDGGDSWMRMGLEKTERIARIVIHPSRPDTVLVAATGPLFSDSPERGIYRTTDGGKTWTKTLYVDARTGGADLAMDPQNPDIVYAAMWSVRRQAWTFTSGGPGSGLYKSVDCGRTWRRLTAGLPAGELGRSGIAVSPARASRVYAIVEAKSNAFYRSDDSGEHWEKGNDSSNDVTWRPFYFANVVADPKLHDRVYKGGLNLSRRSPASAAVTAARRTTATCMPCGWIPGTPSSSSWVPTAACTCRSTAVTPGARARTCRSGSSIT